MSLAGPIAILVFALLQGVLAQNTTGPRQDAQPTSAARLPDGEFVGLETLKGMGEPHARWFHENTLVVRGTEVILDMNPVVFHNGKKEYSASDGGFLAYRGRLIYKNGQLLVSLRIFESDYIVFPSGPGECEPYSRLFMYPVKRVNGVIEINRKSTRLNSSHLGIS